MRTQEDAIARAEAIRSNMDQSARNRWRVRALLDGGPEAIRALLGDQMDPSEDLPWPNMLASGLTRLAQKVGHRPDPRVAGPTSTQDEKPRKRAEKRERIVEAYDEADRMELQLPQVGRWLPGYGFSVWTIGAEQTNDGILYPTAQLRDPFDCFPGEWGVKQQPEELAVYRIVPPAEAIRLYPEHAEAIKQINVRRGAGGTGAVILTSGQWGNQTGRGVAVVEYYDRDGVHTLIPAIGKRVDFQANPLRSGPAFVVAKRFAFNRLIGQYDHTFGLMASIAKINILTEIAMQDAVMSPTNIYGEMDGQYRVGRFEVNRMPPGTKVERPQANLPYQMFEHINRIERQFRLVAGYPVTDDGQSPLNFATGAGLDELNTAVSLEVREYQKVLRYALQDLDAKRLEWDESVSPARRKPIVVGERPDTVAHAETYQPDKDIKGQFRTERVYGVLSGWDDSAKIVGGLQLLSAKVMDRRTMQENIHGLRNLAGIDERIADDEARELLLAVVGNMATQGDPKALQWAVEMLPEGDQKEKYLKLLAPEEPAPGGQADPMGQLAQAGQAGGAPPDIMTVLSRMQSGGQTEAGAQVVARV